MIRPATEQDVPAIVWMAMRALREGPYATIIKENLEVVERLVKNLLGHPQAKILIAEREGKARGVMGFVVYNHFYSGEPVAQELIWYIEPEARKMTAFGEGAAFELLAEGERQAKQAGAEIMQLTAPSEAIGRIYERRGYKQIEVGYQVRL